jgi:hypothetical protein
MREYIVLLDIETPPMSAENFSQTFGVPASKFEKKELQKGMLWRAESPLGKRATLLEHIISLFRKYPVRDRNHQKRNKATHKAYLNIGVLYDTYTCTVEVPSQCISVLKQHGVGMQFCCYPTEFTQKQGRSKRSVRRVS